MRLRFFLWASADLGVRRSKLSSSRCRSAYIGFLQVTQAARRPLDCPGRSPGLGLKKELQRELYQSRIASAANASEVGAVAAVAIRIGELRVVEKVKEIGAELEVLRFG